MGKRNLSTPDRKSFIRVADCLVIENMLIEPISIKKLIGKLEKLSIRHGRSAMLEFNAGYNNICVHVVRKAPKNST
jgi:hypothetical protein